MAILTTSNFRAKQRRPRNPAGPATTADYVYTTADTLYAGSYLVKNRLTGKVAPCGGAAGGGVTTGDYFYGICLQTKTFGASSGTTVPIEVEGGTVLNAVVAGCTSAAKENKPVYLATDNEADFTLTRPSVDAVAVGRVKRYVSSGYGDVGLFTPEESLDFLLSGLGQHWLILNPNFPLANLTNSSAAISDALVMKGSGTLLSHKLVVNSATTDSNADATITIKINSTAATGTITIGDTSDAAGVKVSPDGAAIEAALSGGVTFEDGDTITAFGAYTNAYSDGAVALEVLIERS